MKDLQSMARKSLKGETHNIYRTKFSVFLIVYRTWKKTEGLQRGTSRLPNHIRNEKLLEEKYGQLIHVNLFNDEVLKKSKIRICENAAITDEEGWKLAYETKNGLYQHYNKLLIAGTRDFPIDHLDDLKLPFDDTSNKTKRGRDADAVE